MPSSHLIHCRPLLLLPSISPSIRVFCRESALCITPSQSWSFLSGLLFTPPRHTAACPPLSRCSGSVRSPSANPPTLLGQGSLDTRPDNGGGLASRSPWEGLRGPVWTWPAPCSSASGSSEGSLGVTQCERLRGELCSPVTAALVSSRTCLSRLHSPCVASCGGLDSFLHTPAGHALARCFLKMPALPMTFLGAFPGGSVGGNPLAHVGDMGSIPSPGGPHMLGNNSAWAPQLLSLCSRAREPQLLRPHATSTEDRVP